MTELELKRVLRGASRDVVERVGALLGPFRVEDADGRVLAGAAGAGEHRFALATEDREIGTVYGPAGGGELAELVLHLYQREVEKRGLAAETLGRYKELAIVYDLGEVLARATDVEAAAEIVIAEAMRFLNASRATLLLLDERGERLDPIASTVQDALPTPLDAAPPLIRDVLTSQRAQFSVEDDQSMMCAPLRTGDQVFGVLVVSHHEPTHWTAGDLKLVTSLATKAADSITRALLHRAQMREQALRGQVERFVSSVLVEAAAPACDEVAVLYCDLGQVTASREAAIDTDAAMQRLERATATSLALLLEYDATVNIARGEMLVAIFAGPTFDHAAATAIDAATALGQVLDARNGGPSDAPVGISLVRATWADEQVFLAGVGSAATLQAHANGRIVTDKATATCAGERARPLEDNPDFCELLP